MQTRAWVIHLLYGLSRLGQWLTDKSMWLHECDETCPSYDHELLDENANLLRNIFKGCIVVGLVIDLVCYKFRNLADAILIFESVSFVIFLLIPTKTYLELSPYVIAAFQFIFFLAFYTDRGVQLVLHISTMALINFFVIGYGYKKGLGVVDVIGHALVLICYFFLCSCISIVIAYISELHSKMANGISQNLRLLNGMHEGLLIIADERNLREASLGEKANEMTVPRILFCNNQANKLVKKYLTTDAGSTPEEDVKTQKAYFNFRSRVFKSVKIGDASNRSGNATVSISASDTDLMSLEDIVNC